MYNARLILLNRRQAPYLPSHILQINNSIYIDTYTALTTKDPNLLTKIGLGFLIGMCHAYLYRLGGYKWYMYLETGECLIEVEEASRIMNQLNVSPLWIEYIEDTLTKLHKKSIKCSIKEAIEYSYLTRNNTYNDITPLEDILMINLPYVQVEEVNASAFERLVFMVFGFFYSTYLQLTGKAD